jgi:F-type H+-transporting ATPase subunit a
MLHISLASEILFHIGPLPVTNTLVTSWIAVVAICLLAYFGTRRNDIIPKGFQNFFESIIEGLYGLVHGVMEDRKQTVKVLPVIATLIFLITMSNWLGLIPGVGTIGFNEIGEHGPEFVPFLRSPNSDLNSTLALAIVSIVITQVFGITAIGFFKYSKKFLNFSGVIPFFVGILELVGEVAHLISFSFRLFGNVFAGEVLLAVIAYLVAYLAPVPFYFLELFVGFIQALVFGLLTLVFIKTAMADHSEHEHEEKHAVEHKTDEARASN